MNPMSGCDIRLVFTLPPRDSTLQYKRCVQLWNNFPYITPLKHSGIKWKRCALCSWDFNINYRVSHETWQLRETIGCPTKHDNWEKLQGVPRNMTIETNYRVSHEIWKWRQTQGGPTKYDNWEKLQGVPRNMTIKTTTGCPTKYDNWDNYRVSHEIWQLRNNLKIVFIIQWLSKVKSESKLKVFRKKYGRHYKIESLLVLSLFTAHIVISELSCLLRHPVYSH